MYSGPGYLEDILKITGGTGVHIILEMLANVNLVKDFGVLAKFGRIVVIGSRGALNFDPRLTMGKDASIHGMSLMNVPEDDLYSIHTGLVAGLENGVVDPVIGRKFALKDAAKAHEAVMQPGAYGKIILKV
jgi:NADPH2:quinone reductase